MTPQEVKQIAAQEPDRAAECARFCRNMANTRIANEDHGGHHEWTQAAETIEASIQPPKRGPGRPPKARVEAAETEAEV